VRQVCVKNSFVSSLKNLKKRLIGSVKKEDAVSKVLGCFKMKNDVKKPHSSAVLNFLGKFLLEFHSCQGKNHSCYKLIFL